MMPRSAVSIEDSVALSQTAPATATHRFDQNGVACQANRHAVGCMASDIYFAVNV